MQLQIEVLRNGQLVGNGRCALPRPDVKEEHPLAGHAGFEIELKPPHFDIEPAEISIRLKGSNNELFEGPFVVGTPAGLVQAAQTAARTANLGGTGLSEIGRAVLRAALSKFCEGQRHRSDYIRLTRVGPSRRAATVRRLNIIIPVYRGLGVTKDCIDSVLQHRCADADAIVLVNDCSPEPQMADLLASYLGAANLFLLTNERNLGFIKSVNRALEFCRDGDVILLNSDTRVFVGGFDEMSRVAHSAGDIGTVTAISNNATIFSYPHPRLAAGTLDDIEWPELAAAALRDNSGVTVDVPTGHGFCLLLKREVLDRLGPLNEIFGRGYGEENDFCCKAADLGYRHVAAAGAFVEHRESVSFGNDKDGLIKANLAQLARLFPEYARTIMEYEKNDDLRRAIMGARCLPIGEGLRCRRQLCPDYRDLARRWHRHRYRRSRSRRRIWRWP
jgi:GT2 family glycosyltransferase